MTEHASKTSRTHDPAIGGRIAEARRTAGFKVGANFATAINVHPSQLSRWESGDVPKVESLREIAEKTGASIDWLVTGEGRGPRNEADSNEVV
jgi:transcriptional regulator with XRE-family HTH domain